MTKSILAIETCSETCSVALLHRGKQSQLISTEPRGHADSILPMVEQLLEKAQIKLKQLDVIAFARGPGAFTGVRIGTSVAQGLAVAGEIPLVTVSSLAVLAQGSYRRTTNTHCLPALDARMSEVYFGIYQLDNNGLMIAEQEDQVAAAGQLISHHEQQHIAQQKRWQCTGPGWNNYAETMQARFNDWHIERSEQPIFPQAMDLLPFAERACVTGNLIDAADALPVYVRDQIVK